MKKIVSNILNSLHTDEKRQWVILIFFDVLISALDILFLTILLYIIHFTAEPVYAKSDKAFFFSIHPVLLVLSFLVCFSIKNLFGFWVLKKQNAFVYAVAARMSKENLENYLRNDYLHYVHVDSSVHMRKIGQEPIEFGQYVLRGLQQIIGQTILILITIIAILIFNASLFLILFSILLPPIFLMGYLMKKWLSSARMNTKRSSERSIQHLYEALGGFIESNIYGKQDFFTKRYVIQQKKLNKDLSVQQNIQGMPSRLIEVFAIFGLFVLILINTVYANTIQIITIGAFMAAAYKIIPGIVKILNSAGQIKTYSFTIKSDKLFLPNPIRHSVREIAAVAFSDISIKYEDHIVLEHFNMKIVSGDLAGISAISGKGKSTIIHLLLGFLDPCAGAIYINEELSDASERQSYWGNIAYVKQQSFLIHDSIVKNITLDEIVDQKKMSEAIEMSGLGELLDQLPEGYDSIIEENGKNISGGQRQRIMLARAFYKEFDMLILDEPFKELDEASEIKILKHLQTIAAKRKIVVLITHNDSSLSFCNKLITIGA